MGNWVELPDVGVGMWWLGRIWDGLKHARVLCRLRGDLRTVVRSCDLRLLCLLPGDAFVALVDHVLPFIRVTIFRTDPTSGRIRGGGVIESSS